MKNKKKKAMRAKLLTAIKQVLKVNKAFLSDKAETTLKKSIKQIVKRTGNARKAAHRNKNQKSHLLKREGKRFLTLDKIKMDGKSLS